MPENYVSICIEIPLYSILLSILVEFDVPVNVVKVKMLLAIFSYMSTIVEYPLEKYTAHKKGK